MDFSVPFAPASLLSFALTSFLIELTPGPNMTYLAFVAAQDGRRAGFATVAGVTLGLAVIGIVAAFGVAELVQSSRLLYEGLRWAGVVFLLYLAWEGWSAGADVVAERRPIARALLHARPRHQSAEPEGRRLLRRRAADLHRRIEAGAACRPWR